MTTKIDLKSLSTQEAEIAQQIMQGLNVHYQTELMHMLLDLYHRQLNDMMSIDDLEGYASRHGIDLQEEYMSRFVDLDDMEEL